jgi:predicted dehydrogenase
MGAFTDEAVRRNAPAIWLPLSHSEAMISQPEITLVALCDIDARLLGRARAQFGVEKGYRDYNTLIEEISPDVLGVATRTPDRPAIVESALAGGVHALHLEKPLCNGVEQLTKLERLLAKQDIACTYGTLRRYFPVYRRARELARSGRFGTLQQIQVCFGPAALFWTHPHSVDMLLFMAGDAEVERVSARLSSGIAIEGSRVDGDPVVRSALLEFSNGVTGLISECGGYDVILSCSEGTITVESDGHRIRSRSGDGKSAYWHVTDLDPGQEGQAAQASGGTRLALDRLVSALRGENAAQVSADKHAIVDGQRMLFACVQSHLAGGAAVDPRHLDPDLWITGRTGDRYA